MPQSKKPRKATAKKHKQGNHRKPAPAKAKTKPQAKPKPKSQSKSRPKGRPRKDSAPKDPAKRPQCASAPQKCEGHFQRCIEEQRRYAREDGTLTPLGLMAMWSELPGDTAFEDGSRDPTDILLDHKGFNLKDIRALKMRLALSDADEYLLRMWEILHAHAAPRIPPLMLERGEHGHTLREDAPEAYHALLGGDPGALKNAAPGTAGRTVMTTDGTGGVQNPDKPFRPRVDGWTEEKTAIFLEEYARCGVIVQAAGKAGISRTSVNRRRKRDPEFDRQMEAAKESSKVSLESAAYKRAVEGVDEPIVSGGKIIGYRKKYSDPLLRMLIERLDAHARHVEGGAPGVLTYEEWKVGWRFDDRDGSKYKSQTAEEVKAELTDKLMQMRERLGLEGDPDEEDEDALEGVE